MSLEVRGLDFAYNRRTRIIAGLSHLIPAGSMTAVTGRSGSGKSTLLYLMSLLLRPTRGTILIDDNDSSAMTDSDRARWRALNFGFVFQDAALDPTRTVLDNILETSLYRGSDRREESAEARRLMRQLGVLVPPSVRPGKLSGGQGQRIALCRALLGTPRFLFADEPTGNLDPISASAVIEAMRSHAFGTNSVIVATHDPRVVHSCDRVLEL